MRLDPAVLSPEQHQQWLREGYALADARAHRRKLRQVLRNLIKRGEKLRADAVAHSDQRDAFLDALMDLLSMDDLDEMQERLA